MTFSESFKQFCMIKVIEPVYRWKALTFGFKIQWLKFWKNLIIVDFLENKRKMPFFENPGNR